MNCSSMVLQAPVPSLEMPMGMDLLIPEMRSSFSITASSMVRRRQIHSRTVARKRIKLRKIARLPSAQGRVATVLVDLDGVVLESVARTTSFLTSRELFRSAGRLGSVAGWNGSMVRFSFAHPWYSQPLLN